MKIYSSEISGSLKVRGDITAENYITRTTVTSMTQSFSSGSTIFGDSGDDTHQFTGSLHISGSSIELGDGNNNIVIGKGSVEAVDSDGRIIKADNITYEKQREFLQADEVGFKRH